MTGRTVLRWAVGALLGAPLVGAVVFLAAVMVTPLPRPDNPEMTEILDAAGKRIDTRATENRVEVPVVEMPQTLLDAIVAVEDDRFYKHRGIDPVGLARALVRNVTAGKVTQGGSTISQQLAKNLYLTHERTLTRKWREAVYTVKLEHTYSKKEILGMYLNTIYLGHGAYGVEVASQNYFGKSVRQLTLAEAAMLAGLPQAPEYYASPDNLAAARRRQHVVLDKMVEAGFVDAERAEAAKEEPIRLAALGGSANRAPYFVHYVINVELRTRYPDVHKNLYQGGYRIYTSLDLAMQQQAEAAVNQANMPYQAALVALDPQNGFIKAWVGGRKEATVKHNRVIVPRQPGSTFKPFVYAAALESRNYTVLNPQLDTKEEWFGRANPKYHVKNFGDKGSNEPRDMRAALKESLNVVTVRWMDTIKPPAVVDMARRMGITTELPTTDLSLALGTKEVTPLELVRAYAPLANGGHRVRPVAILKILDREGNLVAEERPTREPVIDAGLAFIMTDLLKGVVEPGGTAAAVASSVPGRPAAGKTGTTDLSRDAWFVGYTPQLVAGVWVGNDSRESMGNATGSTVAVPVWTAFMQGALAGTQARDWAPPGNVVQREICSVSLLLPNPTCPVKKEWFLAGTGPTTIDTHLHLDRLIPELPDFLRPRQGEEQPPQESRLFPWLRIPLFR